MWNGTAASLNPRPANIIPNPTITPGGSPPPSAAARTRAISSKRVVPISPYIWLIPYSSSADDTAPSRMYFVPASFDFGL